MSLLQPTKQELLRAERSAMKKIEEMDDILRQKNDLLEMVSQDQERMARELSAKDSEIESLKQQRDFAMDEMERLKSENAQLRKSLTEERFKSENSNALSDMCENLYLLVDLTEARCKELLEEITRIRIKIQREAINDRR